MEPVSSEGPVFGRVTVKYEGTMADLAGVTEETFDHTEKQSAGDAMLNFRNRAQALFNNFR